MTQDAEGLKAPTHSRLRARLIEFAEHMRPGTEIRALLVEAAEALKPRRQQRQRKSTAEHDPRGYELSEEGSID
jgi:hypothetical protein